MGFLMTMELLTYFSIFFLTRVWMRWDTFVELFEVFPFGVPGELLVSVAVFAALYDDDIEVVVGLLHGW